MMRLTEDEQKKSFTERQQALSVYSPALEPVAYFQALLGAYHPNNKSFLEALIDIARVKAPIFEVAPAVAGMLEPPYTHVIPHEVNPHLYPSRYPSDMDWETRYRHQLVYDSTYLAKGKRSANAAIEAIELKRLHVQSKLPVIAGILTRTLLEEQYLPDFEDSYDGMMILRAFINAREMFDAEYDTYMTKKEIEEMMGRIASIDGFLPQTGLALRKLRELRTWLNHSEAISCRNPGPSYLILGEALVEMEICPGTLHTIHDYVTIELFGTEVGQQLVDQRLERSAWAKKRLGIHALGKLLNTDGLTTAA